MVLHLYLCHTVYILTDSTGTLSKIGYSDGRVEARQLEVGREYGISFRLYWQLETQDARKLEAAAHRYFGSRRVLGKSRELFQISPELAREFILSLTGPVINADPLAPWPRIPPAPGALFDSKPPWQRVLERLAEKLPERVTAWPRYGVKQLGRDHWRWRDRVIMPAIGIANQHRRLAEIFADTEFYDSWSAALLTAPGASSSAYQMRFGGIRVRARLIPLTVVAPYLPALVKTETPPEGGASR